MNDGRTIEEAISGNRVLLQRAESAKAQDRNDFLADQRIDDGLVARTKALREVMFSGADAFWDGFKIFLALLVLETFALVLKSLLTGTKYEKSVTDSVEAERARDSAATEEAREHNGTVAALNKEARARDKRRVVRLDERADAELDRRLGLEPEVSRQSGTEHAVMDVAKPARLDLRDAHEVDARVAQSSPDRLDEELQRMVDGEGRG